MAIQYVGGPLFDRVYKHVICEYVDDVGLTVLAIYGVNGITFKILAALSEEFGTKRIDVNCDTGTGSDPCHDRTIVIRERTK